MGVSRKENRLVQYVRDLLTSFLSPRAAFKSAAVCERRTCLCAEVVGGDVEGGVDLRVCEVEEERRRRRWKMRTTSKSKSYVNRGLLML